MEEKRIMLSQKRIKKSLKEMKGITGRELAFFEEGGRCFASTMTVTNDMEEVADKFMQSQAEYQTYKDCSYFRVIPEGELEYVLLVEGADEVTDRPPRKPLILEAFLALFRGCKNRRSI